MVWKRKQSTLHLRRVRCPHCGKRFSNLLLHLNHRESRCIGWLDDGPPLHGPPPQSPGDNHHIEDQDTIHRDPTPQDPDEPIPTHWQQPSYHVEFPGAGATYGRMASFLDRFDSDRYSDLRTDNVYYPFAGKHEWELGSFLHSSGLSMQKINEFLKLKMVIIKIFHNPKSLIMSSRSGMPMYLFQLQRRSAVEWKCFPRSLNGNQRRSYLQVTQQVSQCTSFTMTLSTVSNIYLGIHYL